MPNMTEQPVWRSRNRKVLNYFDGAGAGAGAVTLHGSGSDTGMKRGDIFFGTGILQYLQYLYGLISPNCTCESLANISYFTSNCPAATFTSGLLTSGF
jgi:hypothetical protein